MNTLCSYYSGDIKDSIPKGRTTIARVLYGIKNPKPHILHQLELLQAETDAAKRTKLKHGLFQFTPAVTIQDGMGRKYANIESFSGYLPLDFDKLESQEMAEELKFALFESCQYIAASWLSSSKKGVRCLVKIRQVDSVQAFQLHFNAIQNELGDIKGFDTAPKNAVLPLFISHDPDILIRPDEETDTYTKTFTPYRKAPKPFIPNIKSVKSERYLNRITPMIIKINDNGHPQLRAAASVAGGFVGAGYITFDEAISHLENLIRSNAYLSQFGEGKTNSYIKTASEMIKKGANSPIYD